MITVVANLKGGSGKSTVVFNLALWLQMKGQPVVVYDLDPQQTLFDVAEVRREQGMAPALHVYTPEETLLHDLNSHPKSAQVLVDVGAANIDAMKTAIKTSDQLIIPVPPSQPDVWATQKFLDIVDDATGGKYPKMSAFVNRADTHKGVRESDDTEELLKQLPNVDLIPNRLFQRTIFRRSLSEGMAVFEMTKRSKAVEELNAFASVVFPGLV
jgi:chromosome partitioning protein